MSGRLSLPARVTEGRRQLLADAVHLGLAHRREEGQRQRVPRGGFGDRELALAVAELAQVREEVDAGQVGLAGDAALGQTGDRRVAVDLVAEADDVDEPAAPLAAAADERGLDTLDPGEALLVEGGDGGAALEQRVELLDLADAER